MSLIAQAQADIKQITSNLGEFAVDIKLINTTNQIINTKGLHTKIHLAVDTDGNMVNAKKAHISFSEDNILELGFGTGLNVLVTIDEFLKTDKNHVIHYFTIEKYPVDECEVTELSYDSFFDEPNIKEYYRKLHECEWNKTTELFPNFFFTKYHRDFFDLKEIELPKINLVYYDCFGARVQPDLWEKPLFKMVADKMEMGGLLTTYSSKGSVRRILEELNFKVEKKNGPPGKREMINAIKLRKDDSE